MTEHQVALRAADDGGCSIGGERLDRAGASGKPLWWDLPLPPRPRCATRTSRHVHTLVVGAGFAGLSAAYHLLLCDPGHDVVVVDSATVGSGASTRSTGMLTPGIGQSITRLAARLGPEAARELYLASLNATNYAAQLARSVCGGTRVTQSEQLVLAWGAAGERRLRAQENCFKRLSLASSRLSASELQARVRMEPGALPDAEVAALAIPGAGTLHPSAVIDGLAGFVYESGGRIWEQTAVRRIYPGARCLVEFEDGGTITADRVIVTVNADAARLGFYVGRILPVRLQVVATPRLPDTFWARVGWGAEEPIVDTRRLFDYFRKTDDGRVILGGGSPNSAHASAPGAMRVDPSALRALHSGLQRKFGAAVPAPEYAWSGRIGYTLNTLPVIQSLDRSNSALFVGGWSGHGIALSLSSGAWAARFATESAFPDELPLSGFSPPYVPTSALRWAGVRAAGLLYRCLDSFS